MDHYYTKKPQSKSSPKTWTFELSGKTFTFTTDVGVFSKNAVDFGTRLLIEHYKVPQVQGDILDLGCGYGPIGIAIAYKYPERHVKMIDLNERAVNLAEINIRQNNIKNAHVLQSDGFSEIKDHRFASIVTNPPIRAGKSIVYQMFENAKKSLFEGGELWIVIQKKQGAPSAKRKLEELFSIVDVVVRRKGYYVFCAK